MPWWPLLLSSDSLYQKDIFISVQQIFSGLPAASGIGIGAIYIYSPLPLWSQSTTPRRVTSPDQEWERFLVARQRVDEELAHLGQVGNMLLSEIFNVHREILHDRTLTEAIQAAIEAGSDAVTATQQVTADLVRIFQNLSDSYFAGRAADIRDVGHRLLAHLDGISLVQQLSRLPPQTILVAEDLSPFDTSHLPTGNVTGIALAGSAPTAHTAILARSLGLPLICGVGQEILKLPVGLPAVVDGIQGRLYVEPDAETLQAYQETQVRLIHFRAIAEEHSDEPAFTRNGNQIPVRANINSHEDILVLSHAGAEGVGLLRTEYLFQQRTIPPTVDEQIEAYREIATHFPNSVLTVRLLDVGGDKPVQYLPRPAESNPFLGMRGVRLLLRQPELLRDQLQALVTLAQDEPLVHIMRILVPMVSKINEVQQLIAVLESIPDAAELRRGGSLQLGVMIEVPAAALLADRLARLVDFFSIGTNDLSQYTLAADRVNSDVAILANPLDPSVLRLIAMACQAGEMAGIPVSLCGEMAGDPSVTPLLLGLGVAELSVAGPSVALVKEAVRQTDLESARVLAARALQCDRMQEVQELLKV
jgi:multiphosphoryl transfer protein